MCYFLSLVWLRFISRSEDKELDISYHNAEIRENLTKINLIQGQIWNIQRRYAYPFECSTYIFYLIYKHADNKTTTFRTFAKITEDCQRVSKEFEDIRLNKYGYILRAKVQIIKFNTLPCKIIFFSSHSNSKVLLPSPTSSLLPASFRFWLRFYFCDIS